MPMKSVLVITGSSSGVWSPEASGYACGEAQRPDLDPRRRPQDEAVRLVAGVFGQSAEAGNRVGGERRPLAVDLDLDLTLALDRGEGAAGLVVERQVLAVAAGDPRLLPGAAGKVLQRGGDDVDPGAVSRPQRRHRLG